VNVFENSVKNLMITNTVTAAEFGYTGPEHLSGYTFNTTTNSPGTTRIRGWELEYAQSLSFLPGALRGLGVRVSYTHNYGETVIPGLSPHKVSGGVNYAWRRFNANVNALWDDDTPSNTARTAYRRHRATLDASGGWQLTRQTSLFLSARNLTNARLVNVDRFAPSPAVWRTYELYGTNWTMGVKGTF
jgi:outer membrane receptor protein involved in Fe transport